MYKSIRVAPWGFPPVVHLSPSREPIMNLTRHIASLSLLLTSYGCLGYTSWVGPYDVVKASATYWALRFDYVIADVEFPGMDDPITPCISSSCIFGPMSRTGLGPSGNACDSGGTCSPSESQGVLLPQGATWREGYRKFIERYGASGQFERKKWALNPFSPDFRWDHLCVGFAALKAQGTSISVLAPGAACGSIPKPGLSCTISMPATIDLGVHPVGTADASAEAYGVVDCDNSASVTASVLNHPEIDGHTVDMLVNGRTLTAENTVIGSGTSVPLRVSAVIRGTLQNAGVYSTGAVLQISYH
uniref:Fimbrial protein n=1 Tax=Pectobacterium carotovorum TaxID=554 RepID=A0A0N9NN25_PECCA|nr:Hypothetical protein [Pectobacterium carotovorum]